ncbi:MAG TPA: rhomboid family intramembrane serine protease [Chitinophagaceae bacterium]|nr:rhomboid family intramembrane serine protease [Chitinophagaceae bacterium]
MGESDRYIDRRLKKISLGEDNNALIALISINIVCLAVFGIIKLLYLFIGNSTVGFASEILPWSILPARLLSLAKAPWTVLTYMFIHTRVLTGITNLIWLWAFGSILQDMAGNKKIIPIYLYGGFAGAVVFVAANYAMPVLHANMNVAYLEGASASIMAIAIATTTLAPDYRIFRMLNGGIPLWVLTILFVVVDFADLGTAAPAHLLAHISGALIGFLYVMQLRRGYDWGAWMNNMYDWFINLFDPDKKKAPPQKTRDKLFYKAGNQKPFEKHSMITQQRIDEILDKINQKGFHHLSDEEKSILKRAAESDLH